MIISELSSDDEHRKRLYERIAQLKLVPKSAIEMTATAGETPDSAEQQHSPAKAESGDDKEYSAVELLVYLAQEDAYPQFATLQSDLVTAMILAADAYQNAYLNYRHELKALTHEKGKGATTKELRELTELSLWFDEAFLCAAKEVKASDHGPSVKILPIHAAFPNTAFMSKPGCVLDQFETVSDYLRTFHREEPKIRCCAQGEDIVRAVGILERRWDANRKQILIECYRRAAAFDFNKVQLAGNPPQATYHCEPLAAKMLIASARRKKYANQGDQFASMQDLRKLASFYVRHSTPEHPTADMTALLKRIPRVEHTSKIFTAGDNAYVLPWQLFDGVEVADWKSDFSVSDKSSKYKVAMLTFLGKWEVFADVELSMQQIKKKNHISNSINDAKETLIACQTLEASLSSLNTALGEIKATMNPSSFFGKLSMRAALHKNGRGKVYAGILQNAEKLHHRQLKIFVLFKLKKLREIIADKALLGELFRSSPEEQKALGIDPDALDMLILQAMIVGIDAKDYEHITHHLAVLRRDDALATESKAKEYTFDEVMSGADDICLAYQFDPDAWYRCSLGDRFSLKLFLLRPDFPNIFASMCVQCNPPPLVLAVNNLNVEEAILFIEMLNIFHPELITEQYYSDLVSAILLLDDSKRIKLIDAIKKLDIFPEKLKESLNDDGRFRQAVLDKNIETVCYYCLHIDDIEISKDTIVEQLPMIFRLAREQSHHVLIMTAIELAIDFGLSPQELGAASSSDSLHLFLQAATANMATLSKTEIHDFLISPLLGKVFNHCLQGKPNYEQLAYLILDAKQSELTEYYLETALQECQDLNAATRLIAVLGHMQVEPEERVVQFRSIVDTVYLSRPQSYTQEHIAQAIHALGEGRTAHSPEATALVDYFHACIASLKIIVSETSSATEAADLAMTVMRSFNNDIRVLRMISQEVPEIAFSAKTQKMLASHSPEQLAQREQRLVKSMEDWKQNRKDIHKGKMASPIKVETWRDLVVILEERQRQIGSRKLISRVVNLGVGNQKLEAAYFQNLRDAILQHCAATNCQHFQLDSPINFEQLSDLMANQPKFGGSGFSSGSIQFIALIYNMIDAGLQTALEAAKSAKSDPDQFSEPGGTFVEALAGHVKQVHLAEQRAVASEDELMGMEKKELPGDEDARDTYMSMRQ